MVCRAAVERYKKCPSCGATFECRPGGCWCDEVKLDAPTRASLRAAYADCLCPACLQRAAAGPPPRP